MAYCLTHAVTYIIVIIPVFIFCSDFVDVIVVRVIC